MEIDKLLSVINLIVETYVYGKEHGNVSQFKRTKRVILNREHVEALLEAIELFTYHLRLMPDTGDKETREYVVFRLIEAYDALARAYRKIHHFHAKEGEEDAVSFLSKKLIRGKSKRETETEDED